MFEKNYGNSSFVTNRKVVEALRIKIILTEILKDKLKLLTVCK